MTQRSKKLNASRPSADAKSWGFFPIHQRMGLLSSTTNSFDAINRAKKEGRIQNVPKRIDWAYGTKGHGRCKRRHDDGLMLTGPVASAWLCTFLLLGNCKCSLRQEDIRKAVAVFFRAAAAVAD